MTQINYDEYFEKHCARYYGWLNSTKKYIKERGKTPLKYFTLCAKEAIDVFMFEKENILSRDANGNLNNVYICEKNPEVALEILKLVRPPLKEAILVENLEKILNFQDTAETRDLSLNDEKRHSYRIRNLLKIKELQIRLKNYFPFDIINFDPYNNLLNPEPNKNNLYKSLKKIFELQENINDFIIFITNPIHDVSKQVEDCFKKDFNSNIKNHNEINEKIKERFHTISFKDIDSMYRRSIGFAKSIVIPAAKQYNWNHKHYGIFVYENSSGNKMLSSVIKFFKCKTGYNETNYLNDILNIVKNMPEYYSFTDSSKNKEIQKHLESIIEYREDIRTQYQ